MVKHLTKAVCSLCVFLLASSFLSAQIQTGNIYGKVSDEERTPLPGVNIKLESPRVVAQTYVSSESGEFRFLFLPPGTYKITFELAGFNRFVQENIRVIVGGNVDLNITMSLAKLEEEIMVSAVSPIVDIKKTGIASNVTQEILTNIPTARDPWVILNQLPGVQMDRVNVGGTQSGQQAGYIAGGQTSGQTVWSMDGVNITDQAATGASICYYDFDSFEEIMVSLAGNDIKQQTPGVGINLVTRRGSNVYRGSARFYKTDQAWQAHNVPADLAALGYKGDRINSIKDYGVEFGGPIIKDKLFFWGSYGIQDIKMWTILGTADDTLLEGSNFKLDYQLLSNNRVEGFISYDDKRKWGRSAGPDRPAECTWDQKGPVPIMKISDEHVFGPNLFLKAQFGYVGGGFELAPRGGVDKQPLYDEIYAMNYNTANDYYHCERPSYTAVLDGSYFLEKFLGGTHEFKFGVEYRLMPTTTLDEYSGGCWGYLEGGTSIYADIYSDYIGKFASDRYGFYLRDTFVKGRLTLNIGLRYDQEHSWNKAATRPASRFDPTIIPEFSFPAWDPGNAWKTFSPRIGATYDITGDGKTLARLNLAQYGDQMGNWLATWESFGDITLFEYFWTDDGDRIIEPSELTGYPDTPYYSYNWPVGTEPWNKIDRNLKTRLTDELIVGLDREIMEDFSVSGSFIYRKMHRDWWSQPWRDVNGDWEVDAGELITSDDFVVGQTVTYAGYSVDVYHCNYSHPGRYYITQRPDYYQRFTGVQFAFNKRLSHRWMLNGSFSWNDWRQYFPTTASYIDPTQIEFYDGQIVAPESGGSGKTRIWTNARWDIKFNGMVQLPLGFNVSGSFLAHEGYMIPERFLAGYYRPGGWGQANLLTEEWGAIRLPTLWVLDLRIEKMLKFNETTNVAVVCDIFNITNNDILLGYQEQLRSTLFGKPREIVNPRVVRLGVRLLF